ncbi:hypothetical protein [Desulfocicer vacuolatum]|uniref:hypothetical protein n=1 Tax=Desulfocicer vacuolatum TaxID=2298 RepID=UPI00111BFB84|nr:hypothetical protein [Desulfocicer vacuolatum]
MKYSANQRCISSFVVGRTRSEYDLSGAVIFGSSHIFYGTSSSGYKEDADVVNKIMMFLQKIDIPAEN